MISVVITTYGRPNYLKNAIDSICKNTYKNYEIIIVDDNGEESSFSRETEKIIKNYKNIELKYIKHEKNYGANKARNTGVKAANGNYIAFLDDDDIFLPNKLEEINTILKTNSDISLIYSGANYRNEKNKIKYKYINFKDYKNKILKHNFIGSNSFVVLKKEKIEKLNGFDETLESCQDWDMWIRIIYSGEKIWGINKALVEYKIHDDENRISNNREKRLNGHRKLFKKCEVYLENFTEKEKKEIKAYQEKIIAYIEYSCENEKKYKEIMSKIQNEIQLTLFDRIRYFLSKINFYLINNSIKYKK